MKHLAISITTRDHIGFPVVTTTIHYEGPREETLCGHDTVGDNMSDEKWDQAVPTTKRVNCPHCIQFRDHVLGRI
jgi:hypothetical protein